jgi:tRNA(Glu) U13 pseudouridine synthase TruD
MHKCLNIVISFQRTIERRIYTDDIDDEEIEGGKRTFSVEEKLKSDDFVFENNFMEEMDGCGKCLLYLLYKCTRDTMV